MPARRTLASATFAALAVAGLTATAAPASAAPPSGSPLATYIVTVDPDRAPAGIAQRARGLGGEIRHVYTAALNGFAVRLPGAAAAELSRLPGVARVEADQVVQARPQKTPAPAPSGVTWGLDRIDQRDRTLDGAYKPSGTGAGVTAYVVDTGIKSSHSDFGDRVGAGYNAVPGTNSTEDCNGHGTHVAGTIGGATYGVAKAVSLVPVRVLDCNGSGTISGVIAGVDWVTETHVAGAPAVANMSLGGGISDSLDDAVSASIADGVTYAVAAGNGNQGGRGQDACNYSPARVPGALTVGATDTSDTAASFSNYGDCVDLFAPGVSITSDWYTSTTATNTISGTSMAAPHVAGAAAIFLQTHVTATPADVAAAITGNASQGVVRKTATANNDLLFAVLPTT